MNINKMKLIGVVVLCVCGICLSIAMGIWIYNLKSGYGVVQNKYVSWAAVVKINLSEKYPVNSVVDGDTIKTTIEGHSVTVRLLGINTPEVVDTRKPVECFGPEASFETKLLLEGKNVFLALNPNYERIDKYGRLLAYVRLPSNYLSENDYQNMNISSTTNDLFINEYLIKEGYAYEYTFNEKNPYQYQSEFKADQREAKNAKKGLWGVCK